MQKETQKNLYLHLPFCETKCHYCDFFSLPEEKLPSETRKGIYNSIALEVELHKEFGHLQPVETLFLGGGTPSLVPIEELTHVLKHIEFKSNYEATLEANPSSISTKKAKEWRELRLNRVSIGVQALNDLRLSWLGRVHNVKDTFLALDSVFSAGFKRVSIDYIVGVPGQTVEVISTELENLFRSFPQIEHVSAYLLTLKDSNSKFQELPSEEEQLSHLHCVANILSSHGFEHYEISNFAKPGCRARHNENYWLGNSYLGIGPSAHSYWKGSQTRTKNWSNLKQYGDSIKTQRLPLEWEESLNKDQVKLETLMLGLRRKEGLDLNMFRSIFNEDLITAKSAIIDKLVKSGLCHYSESATQPMLKLTRQGFFLSDQIVSALH